VALPPLDRSTIWPYEDAQPGEHYYARSGHPVGAEAERRLGELEGGRALLFPSGAAATTGVVLGLTEPGRTIAVAEQAYYGTTVTFRLLERWGARFVEFDQTGPPPADADLIWLEAPSNPHLTMPDLDSALAHAGRVLVDATAATPVYLRPLELGADYVLHSATKFLGGHHDVLLGVVACRAEEDAGRLRELRDRCGLTAAPDPAWLLLRSLETLELRMGRHTASATELARRLDGHPAVATVRYPGFGGLLSFDVAGGAGAAKKLETSVRLIVNATSLGGTRTTLETRARWEPERVGPELVRLSVGLEPVEELWDDLNRALSR
jgi:cystathionine gamma-synthase